MIGPLARQVDRQKLMRVYGALMWSMGKIIRTPEVRGGRQRAGPPACVGSAAVKGGMTKHRAGGSVLRMDDG